MGVPFRAGDDIDMVTYSSTAVAIYLRVNVQYRQPNGQLGPPETYATPDITTASDNTQVVSNGPTFNRDGEILGFVVMPGPGQTTIPKRGQTWIIVQLERGEALAVQSLACGYWYDPSVIALGKFDQPGPGGGEGFRRPVALATNVAGNVQTTSVLALSNTIRRIHGLSFYYNAAAVAASRAIQILLEAALGALPTGFTGTSEFWLSATLTLTTGEEGIITVRGENQGFASVADNTALTYSNNSTSPHPFPYTVTENDPVQLRTSITLGEATDVYTIWADIEEWLVI